MSETESVGERRDSRREAEVRSGTARAARFVTSGLTMVFLLAAAAAPSPLYPVYRHAWGFSEFTLTVIFAVYVVALLVAMILGGSLPDILGRRIVLIVGLGLQAVSMVLFVIAGDVPGLIIARIVQGVATGLCTSAATSMIVDNQPNPSLGSVVSGGSSPVGLALGAALAGALVQHAPMPRALVYWVLCAAYLALIAALVWLPEPPGQVRTTTSLISQLRPQIGVPRSVRATFLAVIPGLVAAWAPCGLYLSLGSSMMEEDLGLSSKFGIGLVLACFFLPAPFATLALRNVPASLRSKIAYACLGVGVLVTVVAVLASSLSLYVAASVLAGAGFGLTFSTIMATIGGATHARDRARTFAMTFIVAYTAFALPAVIAGLVAQHWNLKGTFVCYGVAEAALVVLAAATGARALRNAT